MRESRFISHRPQGEAISHQPSGVRMAALAVLVLFVGGVQAVRAGEPSSAYDWGVAYWMPYDNDLERGREPILKAIRKGITGKKVAVAVQGDFADLLGMHRMTITAGGVKDELVGSDDSADSEQLIAYLEWFTKTFRCRKYVVIVMNHGGGVDEMCLDDLPETPGRNWMSGKKLGAGLRRLKAKMPGTWELLFLQQCGRASLENLYSFRGTAKFVMASPMKIGAPNTYYTDFHKFLAAAPGAAGDRVAEVIGTKDQHYFVYACARADKLAELPARLNAAIKPFIEKNALAAPPRPAPVYSGKVGKRDTVSAADYMKALAAANNNTGASEVGDFLKWVRQELLTKTWHSAHADARARSGLALGVSLHAPANAAEAAACSDLDIYAGSKLDELWKKLNGRPQQ